ncbi:MAG TPA: hypothetical protein VFT31_09220 [Kribbella sp.]|nr:hypothetical protein [Kribbella sp.]
MIAELGYVPSARAVGLARGRARIVGMLVLSLTWPWMGEVFNGQPLPEEPQVLPTTLIVRGSTAPWAVPADSPEPNPSRRS